MGARKQRAKKPRGDGGADVRAFTVVVEEIHAKINVFGEKLQGLDEGLDELRAEVRAGFKDVDRRFELVDQRFVGVDQRFDGVDRELALVKAAVLGINRETKELHRADEALDARKVDRDEVEGVVERVLARKGVN